MSKADKESIIKFVKDFRDGKLELHQVSEPIPADKDNAGPVKTIVGKTYMQHAGDRTKDMLLLFWMAGNEEVEKIIPHF